MSAFVLAIVGGSAAGKSTLAAAVRDALAPQSALILTEDDYYVPRGNVDDPATRNYDEPAAKDLDLFAAHLAAAKRGDAFERPIYDFALHDRIGTAPTAPADFVIIDGMHALGAPAVRALVDWSVFLSAPASERLKRRLARDVLERGRTPQSVAAQFDAFVAPMHVAHVEPLAALADETLLWRPEMGLNAAAEGARLAQLMRMQTRRESAIA
jgi:uridine kinase